MQLLTLDANTFFFAISLYLYREKQNWVSIHTHTTAIKCSNKWHFRKIHYLAERHVGYQIIPKTKTTKSAFDAIVFAATYTDIETNGNSNSNRKKKTKQLRVEQNACGILRNTYQAQLVFQKHKQSVKFIWFLILWNNYCNNNNNYGNSISSKTSTKQQQ